jgi:ATP-binding cassette subfamily B protein/subfamily B ATP-binding cassette protein MsbA
MLLMLLGVMFSVLAPWPLKLIVDNVLPGKPMPASTNWMTNIPGGDSPGAMLAWLAGSSLLLFACNQLTTALRAYIQTSTAARMKFDLGAMVFDYLQRLSLRFHGNQRTGDLVRRVTADTDCVRQLVISVMLPALTSVVTLVVMFSIMWRLDRSLAVLALVAAIPLPLLMKRMAPRMTERSYEQQQALGDLMALAEQTMSSLPVVQAFGREPHQDQQFHGASGRAIHTYMRTIVSQLYYKVFVSSATTLGTVAVMILGGWHVLEGALTIGSLLVVLSYLASMYQPLETIAYLSTGYADAAGRARRVLEVLDSEEMVQERPGARKLPAPASKQGISVQLEGVSFGYEPGHPVLEDVTLEAQPGETIALVGATGAGKSTLVSLIPRFFDPWSGRVLIDGVDVRELTLACLRSQIALVLQEPFLLPLTVAENITYGRPEASREEIEAAAASANADEFIRKMPNGYGTVIGERGATLSGGQRQRIAIARALLKDAPILILDEPTSALDAGTESHLLEALERLKANRTTFIIAHRLSTIRDADRVVTLKDRRLIESSTNATLKTGDQDNGRLPTAHV